LVFCDFHGHSKRKNVFIFGNNPKESWLPVDRRNESKDFIMFPKLLHLVAPGFSLSNCRFAVEKNKESTARVVAWRQFGMARAYTMEASYCGFDEKDYKGFQVGTKELIEMGEKFCEALLELRSLRNENQISGQRTLFTADSDSDDEEQLSDTLVKFSRDYDSD